MLSNGISRPSQSGMIDIDGKYEKKLLLPVMDKVELKGHKDVSFEASLYHTHSGYANHYEGRAQDCCRMSDIIAYTYLAYQETTLAQPCNR